MARNPYDPEAPYPWAPWPPDEPPVPPYGVGADQPTPRGADTPPVDGGTPTKPTTRWPSNVPKPPQVDPDSVWNEDWWDGKSPYLGGWLVPSSVPVGGGGARPTTPTARNPYEPNFGFDAAPTLEFPEFESAGAFSPRQGTFSFPRFAENPFVPSSWADAEAEPGFAESQQRLMRSIEQGAANRGVLRSGKTLTDEAYGLNDFKQQNFRNFDDRRFRNWQGNESNRFNAWKGNLEGDEWKFLTEYGIDKDIFDRRATDVDRGNNYRFNVADARHKDALSRWQSMVQSLTQLGSSYPS